MSHPDAPESSPDDPPASPPSVRKVKAPKGGIQFDRWGIKADINPARVGEPEPHSAKDVWASIKGSFRRIAVDLCGLLADALHSSRRLVRGVGQMPPSKRARVERAHDAAERAEARRQELHGVGELPGLDDSAVAKQLVDLLAEIQSRGVMVEIRELPDGSPAIVMVGHQHAEAAEKIIAAALPALGPETPGSSSIPVANVLTHRLSVILEEHGISTFGQLCDHSAFDLSLIDGIGEKSLRQIRVALAQLGLAMKADEAS